MRFRQRVQRYAVPAAIALVGVGLLVAAGVTSMTAKGGSPPDTREERVLPLPAPFLAWGRPGSLRPRPLPPPTLPWSDVRTPRKLVRARLRASGQLPDPARIEIPAIGVAAPIVPLGLNRNGTLEVPKRPDDTGWFVDGPEPGERGAAVIAGHVDSHTGPAVFYHLRALRRGDRIRVVLKSGARVSFVVRGGQEYSKRTFPVKVVYARTERPTLRLITCDGRFDRASHHYVDNYVVFATRVS
jgi:hypothetical protein